MLDQTLQPKLKCININDMVCAILYVISNMCIAYIYIYIHTHIYTYTQPRPAVYLAAQYPVGGSIQRHSVLHYMLCIYVYIYILERERYIDNNTHVYTYIYIYTHYDNSNIDPADGDELQPLSIM